MRQPFEILGGEVAPGSRAVIDVPMPKLSSHSSLGMPVHVVHGRRPGPVLFLSAAIHGDELNGIEIIRRVLACKALNGIKGTLIAVPVVNVYGLIHESRYLPDRRDLNRSFPGSDHGSLAARLADLFMEEIRSAPTSTTRRPAAWPTASACRSCSTPCCVTAPCARRPARSACRS
jgi:predicted deacylase